MTDIDITLIVALLPLAAVMVVVQTNPYSALVVRGILGAIAALVYAVLGAADVALTEALVGTMLAITLYAVAVRSSLVMRLGLVAPVPGEPETQPALPTPVGIEVGSLGSGSQPEADLAVSEAAEADDPFTTLLASLRQALAPHHLRLELVHYADSAALEQALGAGEIHAACQRRAIAPESAAGQETRPYETRVRVRRLYDLIQDDSLLAVTTLHPISPATSEAVKS